MKQITYSKDVYIELSSPEAYGITPPDGKTYADFKGWRTCIPSNPPTGITPLTDAANDQNYVSVSCISAKKIMYYFSNRRIYLPAKIKMTDIDRSPSFYAVWDAFGWKNDTLSTDSYVYYNTINDGLIADTTHDINDCGAYNIDSYETTTPENQKTINEYSKIKFNIQNVNGKIINNVYLNNKLFAGIDVDTAYWLNNKNTLYYGLDNSTSSTYAWSKPLSATAETKTFSFVMTSNHVSSDNLMHVSCDVSTTVGNVLLYSDYNEQKS